MGQFFQGNVGQGQGLGQGQGVPANVPGAMPVGGAATAMGGIFRMNGTITRPNSRNFMRPGTIWGRIISAALGTNRSLTANYVVELQCIHIVDPKLDVCQSGNQQAMRLGERLHWNPSVASMGVEFFAQQINGFLIGAIGLDCSGWAPQQFEQKLIELQNNHTLENHVVEIDVNKIQTRGGNGKTPKLIDAATWVRRVPWQQVAMLLSLDEQKQHFGNLMDQMCDAEIKGGLPVQGYQPGIAGSGAANSPGAQALLKYRPGFPPAATAPAPQGQQGGPVGMQGQQGGPVGMQAPHSIFRP